MTSELERLNQVSVSLVDDAPIVRRAIKGLLESEPQIELLGEGDSFQKAVALATSLKPDVILLDLHMRDDFSFEAAFVKEKLSASRVLAMSLPCEKFDETKALAERFGAVLMLDKAELHKLLIPAILSERRPLQVPRVTTAHAIQEITPER